MTRPPVRWADTDLPEELSRLIASAAPSQHDNVALARMRERLQSSLGPTFETRLSGPNHTSQVLSVLQRGKWLCAAALATAGLAFVSVQSLHRVSSGSQPSAADTTPPTREQPAPPQPLPVPADVYEVSTAQAERADSVRPPANGKAPGGADRGRAHARTDQSAKLHNATGNGAAKKAAVSGDGAPSGLAAELQGLAEIRRLLHSSPTRALASAAAQEQRFAQGALGPERELLRIEALIRAGRADEAKQRATRALSASNNPPYRARIEKLFAQKPSLRMASDGVAQQVTRE